jgi:Killer toxin-resistance protein 1
MRTYLFLGLLVGPQIALADNDAPHLADWRGEVTSAQQPSEPTGQKYGSMQSSDLFGTFGQLIPHHLRQFIFDANQQHEEEHNIERRQAVAPGGGIAPGEISFPTQMPSVTAFQLSGKVVQYTQTFPPTPGRWPEPTNGAIGLGTIQGQIGTVKNNGGS